MNGRRDLLRGAAGVLTAGWVRGAEAAAGGTLTVALAINPITCDPINMGNHDSEILSQTIWENLVEYDADGVLRPQLAKSLPTISDDKLTYSFELRDDVLFQNGQKLTAADVKYSFEYLLDPRHKASRAPIFNRLSHVEIDGPYRLRVILRQPHSAWTAFLTKYMGIWPAGSRETYGEDYFRRSPIGVGTGPGIFEEWKPNDYVSFRRNPNYWIKGLPRWERLVVKIVPEDATRVAYLLTGQADIIGEPPPKDFARLKSRPGISGAARATLGGWSFMALNNARPPFDDVNFRRALAHGIDRKTICEKIYYGLVEQSAIPAPASSWWYNADADRSLDYDPDRARDFLARSRYADGASFELTTPSVPYMLDTRDCAVFLQAELAKLNIKVSLKLLDYNVMLPKLLHGELDAFLGNLMSPGEPSYFIMVSFLANQYMSQMSGFTDPRLEVLMQTALRETEQEMLKPVYAEILKLLADQSPYIWLGFCDAANLWRDRVKNFTVNQGLAINARDVSVE